MATKFAPLPVAVLMWLLCLVSHAHENDRKCHTPLQPTLGPNVTTVTGTPPSTATPAGSKAIAVHVTHEYIDSHYVRTTLGNQRILLNPGERVVKNFYARSLDGNPRELMLLFDGKVVIAAIGYYYKYYSRISMKTTVTWTCERASLDFGGSKGITFAKNSGSSTTRDSLEIGVSNRDEPIGVQQDLECVDITFPSMDEPGGAAGPSPALLNVTQMYYEQVGYTQWCCYDHWNQTRLLSFEEGDTQLLQIHYEPSGTGGFQVESRNPRNLTITYRGGRFYLAMAKQVCGKYASASSSTGWSTSETWTCKESYLKLTSDDKGVHRLDFYNGIQSTGSTTGFIGRDGYLLVSNSNHVTKATMSCVVSLSVITALVIRLAVG